MKPITNHYAIRITAAKQTDTMVGSATEGEGDQKFTALWNTGWGSFAHAAAKFNKNGIT